MVVAQHVSADILPGPSEFFSCQLSHSHDRYLELIIVFRILDPNFFALFQKNLRLPRAIKNTPGHLLSKALKHAQVFSEGIQTSLHSIFFVVGLQLEGFMIGPLVESGGQVMLKVLL